MRFVAGLSAICALCIPGSSRADEVTGLTLSLEAPQGCGDSTDLRRQLGERLGKSAIAPSSVAVTIEPSNGRLLLEIVIASASGGLTEPRRVHGEDCAELVTAAALILSIALVPVDGPTGIFVDIDPGEVISPTRAPSRPLQAERSEKVSVRVGAATAIDNGTLPDVAPGVGTVASILGGPLRVELGALYFPKRRALVTNEPMVGGDLSSFTASGRACLGHGVSVCIGGEWSLMSATGIGVELPENTLFFLWGLTGAGRVERRLSDRVAIVASGEVVGRPQRPSYHLSNPRRLVHRPAWLSVRFWVHGEIVLF